MEEIAQIDKGTMKRVLGVGDLFAVGYGDLGSSIYYALGITAMFALGATPIALLLAGFVFACTALTYAELSSMMRTAGGSASYSRKAFNDLVSFIAGWGLLLDFIVTIAISSFSVAPYLAFFFESLRHTEAQIISAVCVIVALYFINLRGAQHSTRMSWILSSLTLLTQLLVIAFGAVYLLNYNVIEHLKIGVAGSKFSPSWPDFWRGCAMAMVAYTGIESMAQLGGEAKRPAKTVPRAIMWAMVMLLIVYIGISSIALAAVSPQVLSTTYLQNPVAGIVSALPFGGKILGAWVGILAAVLLFVAANAGLIGSSRLAFNMGEFYQIPRFLYKLHPRFKTPYISLAVFGVLAICIILWSRGKLAFLADLYNFGAMLAFFSAHLSLIMLRIKKPDAKRGFKIPFNIKIRGYSIPISAIIGCIVTFLVWCLVIIQKPEGRYLGLAWIAAGLFMYFSYRKKHKITPTGSLKIDKIKVPEFKPTTYKHLLVPTRAGMKTRTLQMACEIARMHKADITAVNIIEVPFSMPLFDTHPKKPRDSERVLKEAEAMAREFHVPIQLKMVHARTVSKAIGELLESGQYDLLVMGAQIKNGATHSVGAVTDEIIRSSECPVWVCFSQIEEKVPVK
ncbi:MAG: Putrescine transporter PotE [Chlamydiia bacterium]|nr:Putrescine transporter PotE [Chlamydiia bacterium]MCH9615560.1 Putrescine transporter PotE [Chlamydiia bacterium]MCH9629215.1 Putrescine transporter PotE [Chlamydiia bacterium]